MKGSFYALLTVIFIALISIPAPAQQNNTITLVIKNEETKEAVAGATVSVKGTANTATSDAAGRAVLADVPAGAQTIEVFFPGYENKEIQFIFPLADAGERDGPDHGQ